MVTWLSSPFSISVCTRSSSGARPTSKCFPRKPSADQGAMHREGASLAKATQLQVGELGFEPSRQVCWPQSPSLDPCTPRSSSQEGLRFIYQSITYGVTLQCQEQSTGWGRRVAESLTRVSPSSASWSRAGRTLSHSLLARWAAHSSEGQGCSKGADPSLGALGGGLGRGRLLALRAHTQSPCPHAACLLPLHCGPSWRRAGLG